MADLQRAVERALIEDVTIEGVRFVDDTVDGLEGRNLECSNCVFERCSFSDLRIERAYFVDCTFTRCDLSSLPLPNSLFSRTSFKGCRAVGLNLTDSILRDTSFSECGLNYANFSSSSSA